MKTYLSALVVCLAASTAVGQLLQAPDADKPAADKDKPAADARPADAGGPADRRGAGGPAGGGAQNGPGAFRGPMGPMSNPMFEAIDADGDGVISRTELRKAARSFASSTRTRTGTSRLPKRRRKAGQAG